MAAPAAPLPVGIALACAQAAPSESHVRVATVAREKHPFIDKQSQIAARKTV